MTPKMSNGEVERRVDMAIMAQQIKQIHEILTGDEGLCKRVKSVEGDVAKAKGIYFVFTLITGFIGTMLGHWWKK